MSLYRKHRPDSFSSLVGQDDIRNTLTNQLANNSLSHAYMFIGTRGTGKTSTAKILAKAVNCKSLLSNGDPCGSCTSCVNYERTSDIFELDAASNNGVDDIRRIIDDCIYPPTSNKYKVYIIDEVHMLSKGAFNALLKTLEEPPSYVIFILATTEPNKIPATILSRCIKLEFKRITTADMVNRMQYICSKENRIAESNALRLIAANADGAMRDALSMLEQAFYLAQGNKILESTVADMLGCSSKDLLLDFVRALFTLDVKSILSFFDYFLKKGKDLQILLNDLTQIVRDFLLIKSCADVELDGTLDYSEQVKAITHDYSINEILLVLHNLTDLSSKIKYSSNPVMFLQTGLALMCISPIKNDIALYAKVDEIQRIVDSMKEDGKVITNEIYVEKITYKETAPIDEPYLFSNYESNTTTQNDTVPDCINNIEIMTTKGTESTSVISAADNRSEILPMSVSKEEPEKPLQSTTPPSLSSVQSFISELKTKDIIFFTYLSNSKIETTDDSCTIKTIPPFITAISQMYGDTFKNAGIKLTLLPM